MKKKNLPTHRRRGKSTHLGPQLFQGEGEATLKRRVSFWSVTMTFPSKVQPAGGCFELQTFYGACWVFVLKSRGDATGGGGGGEVGKSPPKDFKKRGKWKNMGYFHASKLLKLAFLSSLTRKYVLWKGFYHDFSTKKASAPGGGALPYVGGYQVPVNRPPFFTPILHPMTPFFHFCIKFYIKIANFCALRAHFEKFNVFVAILTENLQILHWNCIFAHWMTPFFGSPHQKSPHFLVSTPNDPLFSTKSYTERP